MMNDLEKFRALVRLALVDNKFEDSERDFLYDLAKIQHIDIHMLEELIQEELQSKESERPLSLHLDFDGKIEILADLIKIMKIDGKVYLSEIKFCEMMARMFGFDKRSVGFLSEMVHQDKSIPPNWTHIQTKMQDYVT